MNTSYAAAPSIFCPLMKNVGVALTPRARLGPHLIKKIVPLLLIDATIEGGRIQPELSRIPLQRGGAEGLSAAALPREQGIVVIPELALVGCTSRRIGRICRAIPIEDKWLITVADDNGSVTTRTAS